MQIKAIESIFQMRYCNTKSNQYLGRFDPSEKLRIYRPHTVHI